MGAESRPQNDHRRLRGPPLVFMRGPRSRRPTIVLPAVLATRVGGGPWRDPRAGARGTPLSISVPRETSALALRWRCTKSVGQKVLADDGHTLIRRGLLRGWASEPRPPIT